MYKNRYMVEFPVKFMVKDKVMEGVIEVDSCWVRETERFKGGDYEVINVRVGNTTYVVPKRKVIKIEEVGNV